MVSVLVMLNWLVVMCRLFWLVNLLVVVFSMCVVKICGRCWVWLNWLSGWSVLILVI